MAAHSPKQLCRPRAAADPTGTGLTDPGCPPRARSKPAATATDRNDSGRGIHPEGCPSSFAALFRSCPRQHISSLYALQAKAFPPAFQDRPRSAHSDERHSSCQFPSPCLLWARNYSELRSVPCRLSEQSSSLPEHPRSVYRRNP